MPKEKETLALLDHIHFAIKRMKENLVLDNPFETEIRQFYPKEWEIGLYAKKCIKRRFGIEIYSNAYNCFGISKKQTYCKQNI